MILSKEEYYAINPLFNSVGSQLDYNDYVITNCSECSDEECPHRNNFRRLPKYAGGLGLCYNFDKISEQSDIDPDDMRAALEIFDKHKKREVRT